MQYSTDNVGFTYKTYGETLYCIDFPTISINFIRICGDFPVTFKVITCNAYLFFFIQYLLVYISEKLWGFQTMCNPHPNYMHITGYPVRHGDSLHFLWGKHLQCTQLKSKLLLKSTSNDFICKNQSPLSCWQFFFIKLYLNICLI